MEDRMKKMVAVTCFLLVCSFIFINTGCSLNFGGNKSTNMDAETRSKLISLEERIERLERLEKARQDRERQQQ